jgi:hypothetical protein
LLLDYAFIDLSNAPPLSLLNPLHQPPKPHRDLPQQLLPEPPKPPLNLLLGLPARYLLLHPLPLIRELQYILAPLQLVRLELAEGFEVVAFVAEDGAA